MNAQLKLEKTLLRLSDDTFFSIMRNYLGPLKTPFHKPSLVKKLITFLTNPDVKQRIVLLMDDFDIELLSLIKIFGRISVRDIHRILQNTYEYYQIQYQVINLEERLILIADHEDSLLSINPIFHDIIGTVCHSSLCNRVLIPVVEDIHTKTVQNCTVTFAQLMLNRQIIPFCLSVYLHDSLTIAKDGSFKKRDLQKITALLGNQKDIDIFVSVIQLYNRGFIAAGILHEIKQDVFTLSENTLQEIHASLPDENLKLNGYFILLSLSSVIFPDNVEKGYVLLHVFFAFLTRFKQSNRFLDVNSISRLLYTISVSLSAIHNSKICIKTCIKLLVDTGFLIEHHSDEAIYSVSSEYNDFLTLCKDDLSIHCPSIINRGSTGNSAEKITESHITIDSDFTIFSSPKSDLPEILPLIQFVRPLKIDVGVMYEITKSSFLDALDRGHTTEELISHISKISKKPIPHHIVQTIKNWENSFKRIGIFRGTVLQADAATSRIIESFSEMNIFIKQKLADGIYIMDHENESDWQNLLLQTGIDYIPNKLHGDNGNQFEAQSKDVIQRDIQYVKIRNIDEIFSNYSTPQFRSIIDFLQHCNLDLANTDQPFIEKQSDQRSLYLTELQKLLQGKKLSQNMHDEMHARIQKKLILSKKQLAGNDFHRQVWEAGGLDYQGKLSLCKNAIQSGTDLLEIHMHFLSGEEKVFLLHPEKIENSSGESIILGKSLPNGDSLEFKIRKIVLLRKLKASLFLPNKQ